MTETTRTSSAPEIERGPSAPRSTADAAADAGPPLAPAEIDEPGEEAADSRPSGEPESELPA